MAVVTATDKAAAAVTTVAAAVVVAVDAAEAVAVAVAADVVGSGGATANRQESPGVRIAPKTANRCRWCPARACWKCTPTATASSAIPDNNYTRERTDPFVPGTMIEKFGLREGVLHQRHGAAASPRQQGPRLQEIARRRRHAARRLHERQDVRRADADQPRVVAAAGNRPRAAHHAGDGPAHAAGQGPAGADRRPAAHRQDDPAAAHQPTASRPTIPTSS